MQYTVNPQTLLGHFDIATITFDERSRDEIPQLLRGLQYIYCTPELRTQVFEILKELTPKNVNTKTGRPGMELWKILVMGTLRLNCNANALRYHSGGSISMCLRKLKNCTGMRNKQNGHAYERPHEPTGESGKYENRTENISVNRISS